MAFIFCNIMSELMDVVDWKKLGTHLNISASTLAKIELDYRTIDDCKHNLLMFWLKSDPKASWMRLGAALKQIGHVRKGLEINQKYCKNDPGNAKCYKVCTLVFDAISK